MRGICAGDTADHFAIDAAGNTVVPPRGASDAFLMPYHVERGKIFVRDRFAMAAAMRSSSPHDRGRRFEPDADAPTLVDIGALGGNAPDDILSGQYRCHLPPP